MTRDLLTIVGCGAMAEMYYLPNLRKLSPELKLGCVDTNKERLQRISGSFGVRETFLRMEDAIPRTRLAVIATPPGSHFDLAAKFIEGGSDVLLEKPLTNRGEEARNLMALAKSAGRKVGVNNSRRLFAQSRHIHDAVKQGALGELKSIEYLEGGEFAWPTASGFYFAGGEGARGVFSDRGAHAVDLVCWWLGGETFHLEEAFHDALGGCEALSECRIRRDSTTARVKLSWHNKLENKVRVVGTKATLEGEVYNAGAITRVERGGVRKTITCKDGARNYGGAQLMMCENLVNWFEGKAGPLVEGSEVIPSLELIDTFYATRKAFENTGLEVGL